MNDKSTSHPPAQTEIHSEGGVILGDVDANGNIIMRDQITHNHYYGTSTPLEKPSDIAVSDPLNNPFTSRFRINDPAHFFGRQQIIRELQQSLAIGNSIALIGPSGVGKSSLLYYLYMTRTEWLRDYEAIYLDLHKLQDEKDLCSKIQEELMPLHRTEPRSDKEARRAIRKTLEHRKVLLMLDEVDELVQGDFKVKLQKLLRGLIQDGTLSLLAASRDKINKVFTPSNPTSPLHNVFAPKSLGNFDRAEMDAFIHERLKPVGIRFTLQEQDKLWQDTQGHPGELQRAAESLFNHKITHH